MTPLQRPKQWENKTTLTDAEIAELQRRRTCGGGWGGEEPVIARQTAATKALARPPQLYAKAEASRSKIARFYRRKRAMCSFRNLRSAGLLAAPAVWPHSEGIGVNVTRGMNACS